MRIIKNQLKLKYEESLFSSFSFGSSGELAGIMNEARQRAEELNLLGISISFSEASLLRILLQLSNSVKFVEIGTLTGFSALAILQGLSDDGKLWTFEKNPEHAKIAKALLQKATANGNKSVCVIEGDAETQLSTIADHGPFDGIFIDGNKSAYLRYLDWAEKNIKKNGLIIADNVFLEGSVWGDPTEKFKPKQIQVMKEFNLRLSDTKKYLFSLASTSEGLVVAKKLF